MGITTRTSVTTHSKMHLNAGRGRGRQPQSTPSSPTTALCAARPNRSPGLGRLMACTLQCPMISSGRPGGCPQPDGGYARRLASQDLRILSINLKTHLFMPGTSCLRTFLVIPARRCMSSSTSTVFADAGSRPFCGFACVGLASPALPSQKKMYAHRSDTTCRVRICLARRYDRCSVPSFPHPSSPTKDLLPTRG